MMKNKWLVFVAAVLSMMVLLASCGEDSLLENPDAELSTDAPDTNIPEDTSEDTVPPETTSAPEEKIEIPVISGANPDEFMEFAFENLDFPPFEFDFEFDKVVENEYYTMSYENPNPEKYMAPEGGCIAMVFSPGGQLVRLQIEFVADMDPDDIISAMTSAFYADEDRAAISDWLTDALAADAPASSETVYNGTKIYVGKGYKGVLPLYVYIEAEGAREFMEKYPLAEDAE